MPEDQRLAALRLLKALADETRLQILGLLAQHGELSVGDLARFLNLRDPTISHHLAILRELDLVSVRAEGTTHLYAFRPEVLRRQGKVVLAPERVAGFADEAFEGMGDVAAYDRKVLHDFFDGPRLREIPATRRKRQVILRALVEDFASDRTYTEVEVNAALQAHHPDCATLRREFIASRLMARDHGVYWRIRPAESLPGSPPIPSEA